MIYFSELVEALSLGFLVLCAFMLLILIVLFVLRAVGIYKMSEKAGFKNNVIAFIPVVSDYSIGRLARNYIKKNSAKSADFSGILLVLSILKVVFTAVFLLLFAFATVEIAGNAINAIETDSLMVADMFSSLIPAAAGYIAAFTVSVIYAIVYYVCLWRIFKLYVSPDATLYTIISVIFPFMASIFIFTLRNNEPKTEGGSFEIL